MMITYAIVLAVALVLAAVFMVAPHGGRAEREPVRRLEGGTPCRRHRRR